MDGWHSGHHERGTLKPHNASLRGFGLVKAHTKSPSGERDQCGVQEAGQAVWTHYSVLIHSVFPRSDRAQGQGSS